MKNILVVCTGNTCRSPLIAAILAKYTQNSEFSFSSTGIFTQDGDPASTNSIAAAKSLNIDLSNHRTRETTQNIIDSSDLILCVSKNHKSYILSNFQDVSHKCFTISECLQDGHDIPDPYGQSIEVYQKLANDVIVFTPELLKFLKNFFMTISIGCDHNGYQLAKQIIQHFNRQKFIEHLPESADKRVDYPDFALAVADDVYSGKANWGILICKSGVGMSIAANKHIGIRAALCHNTTMAELSRLHNDANVLCIGSGFTDPKTAFDMVEIFLKSDFQGERHARRLEKISNFEKKQYNKL